MWLDNSTTEHYTEGTFNYTLGSAYTYDSDHRNITQVWHKGDSSGTEEEDDFYTCTQYHSGTGNDGWKASFPQATKKVKIASACNNWVTWDSTNDLAWQKYDYSLDGLMNLSGQGEIHIMLRSGFGIVLLINQDGGCKTLPAPVQVGAGSLILVVVNKRC